MSEPSDHCKAEAAQIKKRLLGGTITKTLLSEDGKTFGFQVQKAGKTLDIWVDQDPEGNGPGHLSIS